MGWNAGPCGSLRLENKNGAIRLSHFQIDDGDYQQRLKQDMLNKSEEIKDFGEKAPYSIPFGEKQIGQFVLYHMHGAYDLNDVTKGRQTQFGTVVTWDANVTYDDQAAGQRINMDQMHIRLMLNENGKNRHVLQVEYPYQLNNIGAAERFNIELKND